MEAIVLIPTYLMLCIVAAVWAGYERRIGLPLSLLICVAFTPVLGVLITLFFRKLPKACCMKDYKDFSTGSCYYFRKIYLGSQPFYYVQHAINHRFSEDEFNTFFAIIVKDREHVADAIAEVN